jgi:hypothetical protein
VDPNIMLSVITLVNTGVQLVQSTQNSTPSGQGVSNDSTR